MSILHEDQRTFLIISRSIVLGMRTFSDKCRTEIKIHILCTIKVFRKSNRL